MPTNLPIIRSHARIDYKRCPKKWYWKWLRGLTPRTENPSALSLGTWVHAAFAVWYASGFKRWGRLVDHFETVSEASFDRHFNSATEQQIEKARQLQMLGVAMMQAYENHYDKDSKVNVIKTELPLEFEISDGNKIIAIHRFKPDMVYFDENNDVWLMEHKTADTIRTEHLIIDDQARPYGAMAEAALKKAGVIRSGVRFRGIMYNFIRKAFPDERKTNELGQYLNKNGSVSKRQPSKLFVRHPLPMGARAKATTLRRVQSESQLLTVLRQSIIDKKIEPSYIPKTPHYSCPKTCQFFQMCVLEEEGADIRDMQRSMFRVEDPNNYPEDTTEDPLSFEMG